MSYLVESNLDDLHLVDTARVSLGSAGLAALQADRWYLVGLLLGPKGNLLGFIGTIPTIWRMKSRLTIHEVGERFVFQFEHKAERSKILHGGPWFYRNTMVVLGNYDGIGLVHEVPLNLVEAWVAVKGLLVGFRNKAALNLVGSALGYVIRFDHNALYWKEAEQRICLVFDVRRRIRVWMLFEFSVTVAPELSFNFEKVPRILSELWLLHAWRGKM
ncbi:uncharacterized protein LOC112164188 [Rosa chinensis]|uniref:uncharacterized protein LOC112164188 n=1 Tax=Rosa chinensis TaxID=74649 RepID=UPI000D08F967|nr:uncharacterized protein LOC112164188 [Rosa chinensis]